MPHTALSIYLQDHLAGSTAGVNLAHRFVKDNAGTPAGRTLAEVGSEIEEDREALLRLMAELRIHPSRMKNAAAWAAERLARLKPNGRMRGEPKLQRVHELESLVMGITGKLALWESLRAAPEVASLAHFDFDELAERARNQRERVDAERLAFARAALAPAARVHVHEPA